MKRHSVHANGSEFADSAFQKCSQTKIQARPLDKTCPGISKKNCHGFIGSKALVVNFMVLTEGITARKISEHDGFLYFSMVSTPEALFFNECCHLSSLTKLPCSAVLN